MREKQLETLARELQLKCTYFNYDSHPDPTEYNITFTKNLATSVIKSQDFQLLLHWQKVFHKAKDHAPQELYGLWGPWCEQLNYTLDTEAPAKEKINGLLLETAYLCLVLCSKDRVKETSYAFRGNKETIFRTLQQARISPQAQKAFTTKGKKMDKLD